MNVTKNALFLSHELQLITVLILICDSYMSWSKILHISLYFCSTKSMDCFTLKKHQQKAVNPLKKVNLWWKSFFQIILNKVLNPQCWHFCKWIKWWFVYIKSINGLSNGKWALIQTQANKPNKFFLVEKVRRFLILHYVLITTLSWKPISKSIINW